MRLCLRIADRLGGHMSRYDTDIRNNGKGFMNGSDILLARKAQEIPIYNKAALEECETSR
jgi:hypothetical protein